jgi:hypothetical protein
MATLGLIGSGYMASATRAQDDVAGPQQHWPDPRAHRSPPGRPARDVLLVAGTAWPAAHTSLRVTAAPSEGIGQYWTEGSNYAAHKLD